MKRFLFEMIRHYWETTNKVPFDLSAADLSDVDSLKLQPLFLNSDQVQENSIGGKSINAQGRRVL